MSTLQQEIKTYNDHLDELLPHRGKYVLIHGDEVVDIFAAYEDALKCGYDRFKTEPFLVKKIESVETILSFTRELGLCHT